MKSLIPHHSQKQLILESDGSPPFCFNNTVLKKMKKIIYALFIILVSFSCKKNDFENNLNIDFTNKPFDSVMYYLKGNWRLLYLKGGFLGPNYVQYVQNSFWTIDTNHIKIIDENIITVDTTLFWNHISINAPQKDSMFMCYYFEKVNPFLQALRVSEIKNNELILVDPGIDAPSYHFKKL